MLLRLPYTLVAQLRLARLRRTVRTICRRFGIQIVGPLSLGDCAVFLEIFRERSYSAFFPFHQNATVVDVGAHKGYFTLYALHCLGPSPRVIAVEPSTHNFHCLQRNLERNRRDGVVCRNAAIGDNSGRTTLHLNSDENNSLVTNYGERVSGRRSERSEEVDIMTFDTLLASNGLDRVDFVKMDCEGAEYAALYGAGPRTLAVCRTLCVEYHDLGSATENGTALAAFLQRMGFTIRAFTCTPSELTVNGGMIVATCGN